MLDKKNFQIYNAYFFDLLCLITLQIGDSGKLALSSSQSYQSREVF